MGLDTSHDCWHGSYSAFSRWRQELADAAGYMSAKVIYDNGEQSIGKTIFVDWGHLQDSMFGDWKETPKDPLLVLIAHSDCEGKIKNAQCGPLAGRLKQLLPKLPKEDDCGHIGNWREKTQKFIDGLIKAAKAGEDVIFH